MSRSAAISGTGSGVGLFRTAVVAVFQMSSGLLPAIHIHVVRLPYTAVRLERSWRLQLSPALPLNAPSEKARYNCAVWQMRRFAEV
jgi:hypothetical protein